MKKALFLIALSALLLRPALPAVAQSPTANVPIIMYHSLMNSGKSTVIHPGAFESDLKYLKEQGYHTVFLADLVNFVHKGTPLPDKPIVLTFDDAYYNVYSRGFPLLKKYDMKIVVSVIGKDTERWSKANYNDEEDGHLSWAQIQEMAGSGLVEIGNHTWNLHQHTNGRKGCRKKKGEDADSYCKILVGDVNKLQQSLLANCGITPIGFAYPYGAICREATENLKAMGFKATLSCSSGVNSLTTGNEACLYELRRFNRSPDRSVKMILESQ